MFIALWLFSPWETALLSCCGAAPHCIFVTKLVMWGSVYKCLVVHASDMEILYAISRIAA